MQYHYLITVQFSCRRWPRHNVVVTRHGLISDVEGWTEQEVYDKIFAGEVKALGSDFDGTVVLFYRLTPNKVL